MQPGAGQRYFSGCRQVLRYRSAVAGGKTSPCWNMQPSPLTPEARSIELRDGQIYRWRG